MSTETIQYQTQGTCCQFMQITLDKETQIIQDADFFGGCNGNLQGIKSLIKGMKIDDVIEKLQGISCNGKPTSCPDQLANCLIKYKQSSQVKML